MMLFDEFKSLNDGNDGKGRSEFGWEIQSDIPALALFRTSKLPQFAFYFEA